MKKTTCAEIGGPETCEVAFVGSTADEMITDAWKHIEEAHPDLAEGIKRNPPEVNEQWMLDFRLKFDGLPEAENAAA